MSVFDKDLQGVSKYQQATDVLKTFCTGKRVLCAFSGGKDSQCCYHLLKEAGIDFAAQYSITRFEPPELMRFIREHYPDVVFRRAYKKSLVDKIAEAGLPSRWARWCCRAKHVKTPGFDIAVIGVRWAESARRAKTWRQFGFKQDKTAYVCPICNWTEADVWEYLNARNIPHCELYDQGRKRIGCVMCPLASPKQMQADAARYPKFANTIKIGIGKMFDHYAAQGFKTIKGREVFGGYDKRDRGKFVDEMFDKWTTTGSSSKFAKENNQAKHEECVFEGSGFSGFDEGKEIER